MKKWLIFSALFLLLGGWALAAFYASVQQNKQDGLDGYYRILEEETNGQIHEVHRFHGNQLYVIFTVEEEESIYYFAVREDGQVKSISFDEIGASKQQVMESASPAEVLRVSPAVTGNQFTWEVVAFDGDDNLQYIYYYMENGAFQQRYTIRD